MNRRNGRLKDSVIDRPAAVVDRPGENQRRVQYAMLSIEEMALAAIRAGLSGTIGVEIPVKDGKLGKVKRLQIVFQPE